MKKIFLFLLLCLLLSCKGRINDTLRKELIRIYSTDQNRALSINDKDFLEKWKRLNITDSINYSRISAILDSIGYPGKSLVGDTAYLAPFYVIQHSNLKAQEHYLPIIQKVAEHNEIEWKYIAMLIDRIKVNKNEKQIYGTQLQPVKDPKTGYITDKVEFCPIEDEANINQRRQKMGLSTIEEYVKQMGVSYPSVRK